MGEVNLTLSIRKRPWFDAAFSVLAFACAAVSIASMHAANWLSDKGTTLLTRYGLVLKTP